MAKTKTVNSNCKLVIAGPGAGKTHGMVNHIISVLPDLKFNKYLVVITYTNAAANNIKDRIGKKITLPPNIFIGTIHSFLNRFILIPYCSIIDKKVAVEKKFIQVGLDEILYIATKQKKIKAGDHVAKAVYKKNLLESLSKRGAITYDHTIKLSQDAIKSSKIKAIIANRIQYLFIDEFQDTGNDQFSIFEEIRKEGKTNIYCVGDPEQYISGYQSTQSFKNIPINKISGKTIYKIEFNTNNHRCSSSIVSFLNNFNKVYYGNICFQQTPINNSTCLNVKFINTSNDLKAIIEKFYQVCNDSQIKESDRCILAKENKVIGRINASLNFNSRTIKRNSNSSPLNLIKSTLLTSVNMNQKDFCSKFEVDDIGLRKICVKIYKAIINEQIKDENQFVNYIIKEFQLTPNIEVPINIDQLKDCFNIKNYIDKPIVSNIHNFKGLEAEAVLAVASSVEELNMWLETDINKRSSESDNKKYKDYCRLGYVAFSRAEKLLCIACLQNITAEMQKQFNQLGVKLI